MAYMIRLSRLLAGYHPPPFLDSVGLVIVCLRGVFADAGFHVGKDEAENALHVGLELRGGLSRVSQVIHETGLLPSANPVQALVDRGGVGGHD
jgi:hypothetical protein